MRPVVRECPPSLVNSYERGRERVGVPLIVSEVFVVFISSVHATRKAFEVKSPRAVGTIVFKVPDLHDFFVYHISGPCAAGVIPFAGVRADVRTVNLRGSTFPPNLDS